MNWEDLIENKENISYYIAKGIGTGKEIREQGI